MVGFGYGVEENTRLHFYMMKANAATYMSLAGYKSTYEYILPDTHSTTSYCGFNPNILDPSETEKAVIEETYGPFNSIVSKVVHNIVSRCCEIEQRKNLFGSTSTLE